MHELSIAKEIITIVKESIPDSTWKVKTVKVKVGKLSGVLIDSLKFSYESIVRNTELEGSQIDVEEIPLKLFCRKCLNEFDTNDYIFYCVNCNSSEIEVKAGNELFVSEVELKSNED